MDTRGDARRKQQNRELDQKGAMGLMQIMPKTWAELRARYVPGADPLILHNILAGAHASATLRSLRSAGFLAAGNGIHRYESVIWRPVDRCRRDAARTSRRSPTINRAPTNGSLVLSQSRLPGPALHCSRRLPAAHLMVAPPLAHARTVALSTAS